MRNRIRSVLQAIQTRVIGTHVGTCAGVVKYTSGPSMGFLWCEKCQASSLKGLSPEYIKPSNKTN